MLQANANIIYTILYIIFDKLIHLADGCGQQKIIIIITGCKRTKEVPLLPSSRLR